MYRNVLKILDIIQKNKPSNKNIQLRITRDQARLTWFETILTYAQTSPFTYSDNISLIVNTFTVQLNAHLLKQENKINI